MWGSRRSRRKGCCGRCCCGSSILSQCTTADRTTAVQPVVPGICGMEMDEEVWNHAVFSKNRERLRSEEIAEGFFRRVIERAKPFMSDEHFTVDGTLIEAWASHKSFR